MCFCCCTTRKSILIYLIVVSSFAFIYGIIAIAEFGSSTDIYDYLIKTLDRLENQGSSGSSRRLYCYPGDYGYPYCNSYDYDLAKSILDTASVAQIDQLTYEDISGKSYGLVKSLKGIENGLGVILFIFPIIFLAAEIVFLVFAWGNKEYQIMKTSTYNILYGIKIAAYALAIIFIFLAILYGILLIVALVQYIGLVKIFDSCAIGIVIGMVYGYYCFWYYIILSCGLASERNLFVGVGSEEKPGPNAQYDVNGNPIVRAVIAATPAIIGVSPQMVVQPVQPMTIPYQQVPVYNQNPVQQTSPVIYQQSQMPMQQQIQDKNVDPNTGRKLNDNQVINVNNNQ
jgi:hypothetical protein